MFSPYVGSARMHSDLAREFNGQNQPEIFDSFAHKFFFFNIPTLNFVLAAPQDNATIAFPKQCIY